MASIIAIWAIIIAVILYILHYLCNNRGLPRNWPLFGMLPELLLNVRCVNDWQTKILKLSACTFLFHGPWFANMDTLLTADPENIHHIMTSNFYNFPKGSGFKKVFEILGDGIFNADLDLWKKQRKVAQALLNHRLFYQFVVKTTQRKLEKGLIPVLDHVSKQGLVVDLQDLFQRFMFDTTSMTVTGYDPQCLSSEFPEVAFSKAMDDAQEAIFYRYCVPGSVWKLQRWLGIGAEKKLTKAWKLFNQIIGEIIMEKKEVSKTGMKFGEKRQGVDLLSWYMSEDNIAGLKPDDNFLRDTVLSFLFAGRDTTSSALSWFFWLVSKNPHVEAKITEELKSTLPAAESDKSWYLFDIDKLKGLAYLHGAMCESLRLYPPLPIQLKAPLRSDTLPSGHHVNPKMKIMFSLYAMGRMTSIWGNDCLEFKPERWISECGEIKHEPSYKFFAFNAGPRTCLGKDVAFTQMKAVAASIIHNYHVRVIDGQSVIPKVSLLLHMKHGMRVRLTKRWPS